jgi:ribosomal protein S18 acetylase RimI-like enzyme
MAFMEGQMAETQETCKVKIREMEWGDEMATCARMMSSAEPWLTLRIGYDQAMRRLSDSSREAYVAIVDGDCATSAYCDNRLLCQNGIEGETDLIVGFIILCMTGAFVGYIQTVAVMPGWRNRGIGSRLIQFAEERIFRESPNVFICVSDFNDGAQRLYKRLGYTLVGELENYLIPEHAELLLRKSKGPLASFRGIK